MPQPFHVLATQNPIEQEGTWPLPEAQLDRFLTMIHSHADAKAGGHYSGTTGNMPPKVEPVMTPEHMLAATSGTTSCGRHSGARLGRVQVGHPSRLRACPKRTGESINAVPTLAGQALLGMAKVGLLEGRSHIAWWICDGWLVQSCGTGCCPRSNSWPVVVILIPSSTIWCGPSLGSMRHEVW